MGGKSGGGYDAGPMLEYGQKALDLQKNIYDDNIERSGPWYDAGEGAINLLSDLMGIKGGSMRSREQIYDSLMPEYTTKQETPSGGGMWVGWDGALYPSQQDAEQALFRAAQNGDSKARYVLQGHTANPTREYMPSTVEELIDYDGLNSAVDAAMASQETPENYGTLLETFDLDKFEADPGYEFRLGAGNKAIERQLAASGKSFTPAALKALNEYNQGMASQEFGNAYNRFNNDQTNIFNRLAAVSGMGQTSNQTMANAGNNYSDQASSVYGSMGSALTEANAAKAASPSMFDKLLGVGAQMGGAYLGNPMAFM